MTIKIFLYIIIILIICKKYVLVQIQYYFKGTTHVNTQKPVIDSLTWWLQCIQRTNNINKLMRKFMYLLSVPLKEYYTMSFISKEKYTAGKKLSQAVKVLYGCSTFMHIYLLVLK